MRIKTLLFGAAVAAIAVGAASRLAVAQGSDSIESFRGKAMPAFKMTTLDGRTLTNSSLRGKVVLIDFWATWCGPCKMAAPTMQSLHEKFGKQGLVVIGANVWERGNSKQKAQEYAKANKFTYTFTHDNDKLAETMRLNGIPTFLLVDKKGTIRAVQVGFDPRSTPKDLEDQIKRLL
ncbi:MAG: TlpA family protein disulfide reductase [Fimbriimonadales bacterium]|nr:TlpA family protein disulfide reductase [Fimbriimonadales bacterium]